MNQKKLIAIATLFVFANLNAQAETLSMETYQGDSGVNQYEEPAAYDVGEYGVLREEMEPQYESEPEVESSGVEVWEQNPSAAADLEAQGQQEIVQDNEIVQVVEIQEAEESSQYIYEEIKEEAGGDEEYQQDYPTEAQGDDSYAPADEMEQPIQAE